MSRWVVVRRTGPDDQSPEFLAEQPSGEIFWGWNSVEVFDKAATASKWAQRYRGSSGLEVKVISYRQGQRMAARSPNAWNRPRAFRKGAEANR